MVTAMALTEEDALSCRAFPPTIRQQLSEPALDGVVTRFGGAEPDAVDGVRESMAAALVEELYRL